MGVFLSHAGSEVDGPRRLAAALRSAGEEVWLDLDRLRAGDVWMREIEAAVARARAFLVYVGRDGVRRWVDQEVRLALVRHVQDPAFRIVPVLAPGVDPSALPPFLALHHAVRLESLEESAKAILGALQDQAPEHVSLLREDESPFRGLRCFEPEHAHLFFGRDREVAELLERVEADPFVAVIGASGSGKSSLVRAGLIPALHRGRLGAGRADWGVAVVRPGSDPFGELAEGLPQLAPDASRAERAAMTREARDQLGEDPKALRNLIAGFVPAGTRTLLVVDQLEELFSLSPDARGRRRYVETLLAALDREGDHPVSVVACMRADFFAHCFEVPDLPRLLRQSLYTVERMLPPALREVIEQPLALAGADAEPGVSDTLLRDVGDEPGSLALLEFALEELWRQREAGTLRSKVYADMGGVQGAIAARAEVAYAELQRAGRGTAARDLMLQLVRPGRPGEGSADTRQRARLSRTDPELGPAIALLASADYRLLVTSQLESDDPRDADSVVVEVAHEALIARWSRLREWVDTERRWLERIEQLKVEAQRWRDEGRSAEWLRSGAPLAEVRELLRDRPKLVPPALHDYLDACRAASRRRLRRRAIQAALLAPILVLLALAGTRWSQVRLGPVEWIQLIRNPPEMVRIPPGSFLMGSPPDEEGRSDDEGPQHRVTIGYAFEMGRYEVTREEYARFAAVTGRGSQAEIEDDRARHPVTDVSWDDARAYAEWLSKATFRHYRLPSEAEWEYAARAGTTARYIVGEAEADLDRIAWYRDNSGGLHPVGEKDPNPWGLYDVLGNVYEWVEDDYGSYEWAPADGSAWVDRPRGSGRVIRGASWYHSPLGARVADRGRFEPSRRFPGVGFRLARSEDP